MKTLDIVIDNLDYLISPDCTDTQFDYVDEIRDAIQYLKDYRMVKPLIDAISDQVHETASMFRRNANDQ